MHCLISSGSLSLIYLNYHMAKIHTLKISNYRGIQEFNQVFGKTDFICLIGRGDSGKSTILEAISIVLSPSWNLTFYDTDFHNGDVSNPIEIEASLYNLPDRLVQESKYGLYVRGLDANTGIIHDEQMDDHELILTIKLVVSRDLEPKWYVVNNRENQDAIEINASDRASLNVYLISDYVDRHFSWNKGNPLYSLLNEDTRQEEAEKGSIIIDAFREAKKKVDTHAFDNLNATVERIKASTTALGVNVGKIQTTIDFRDIFTRDGKVCLHDDSVPFRLKGKGSKRLISIAIQMELSKSGGILLIDEIEQGLEPDRVQHLAQMLKVNGANQVFITTHSRDVITELEAKDLCVMRKGQQSLSTFDETIQGCLRSNPEAFFSQRVLVGEGHTEVGVCRSINADRIKKGKKNAAYLGVRIANGSGSNQVAYSTAFKTAGYDVCLFCDSDVADINAQKAGLRKSGITILDWDEGKSIEHHVFEELPWEGIKELISYREILKGVDSTAKAVEARFGSPLPTGWKESEIEGIRKALYETSVAKNNEWFKRIDHGMALGAICCKYLGAIEDMSLSTRFTELSEWMDYGA